MSVQYQVLVIDTAEHRLSDMTAGIEARGYVVRGTSCADTAVGLIAHDHPPCIIVCDLPDDWDRADYCHVLRRLMPGAETRILLLTRSGESEADLLRDLMVDDVLPDLSNIQNLAEIAVTLMTPHVRRGLALRHGGFALDIRQGRFSGFGGTLHLNPQLAAIMAYLMREPEQVHSRDAIRLAISREHVLRPRSVDVYVRRLRGAAKAVGMPNPIETIHARGYRLASL
jgi:DNA-binding response OmpR family regulator